MKTVTKALSLGLVALVCFLFGGARAYTDTIYVSTWGVGPEEQNGTDGTIEKFDSNGNRSTFASDVHQPEGLGFDSNGNLYVACLGHTIGSNTIERFDSNGNGVVFASTGLNEPYGLAFDSSNNLYVANAYGGKYGSGGFIAKFDASGNWSFFADPSTSGHYVSPSALAFDSSGHLYAATTFEIYEFDSNGNGTVFASAIRAYNLAFDSAGNLYVSSSGTGDDTIEKFDSNGNRSTYVSGYGTFTGLAFDSSDNLYGVTGNAIYKFDQNGSGTLFASDLDNPTFIAIQVPEPATCSLLGLGVLGLLGSMRLRHRSLWSASRAQTTERPRHRGKDW